MTFRGGKAAAGFGSNFAYENVEIFALSVSVLGATLEAEVSLIGGARPLHFAQHRGLATYCSQRFTDPDGAEDWRARDL